MALVGRMGAGNLSYWKIADIEQTWIKVKYKSKQVTHRLCTKILAAFNIDSTGNENVTVYRTLRYPLEKEMRIIEIQLGNPVLLADEIFISTINIERYDSVCSMIKLANGLLWSKKNNVLF